MKKATKQKKSETFVRSPLKWVGGKSRQLTHIFACAADFPDFKARRFVDVFTGSGVVGVNTALETVWMNDINMDLVGLYRALKYNRSELLATLVDLFSGAHNTLEAYLKLREEFNKTKVKLAASADASTDKNAGEADSTKQPEPTTETASPIRRAAIFVYLNKHAFNGVCRYNSKGGFNVPYGKLTKNPSLNVEELIRFSDALAKVDLLTNLSFDEVLGQCGDGDLVYCDPPYSPREQKSNFTKYTAGTFGPREHARLVELAQEAAGRGAMVIISNHATDETKALYASASKTQIIMAARSINSDGGGRGKVEELMAVYAQSAKSAP